MKIGSIGISCFIQQLDYFHISLDIESIQQGGINQNDYELLRSMTPAELRVDSKDRDAVLSRDYVTCSAKGNLRVRPQSKAARRRMTGMTVVPLYADSK